VTTIHPTSIHWIIRFGSNAEVLTKPATKAKTSFRVSKCTLVHLVCLTGESHWQHCEALLPPTSGMCVGQRWTFWTFKVLIHLAHTDCYI